MGNQRGKVIRQNAEMMDGIFSGLPRRLVVKIDVAGSDTDEDVAHARDNLIKDDFRTEQVAIKPEALVEFGREQMDVMQIAAHVNSSIAQ
jgi:hypothetical protein